LISIKKRSIPIAKASTSPRQIEARQWRGLMYEKTEKRSFRQSIFKRISSRSWRAL